MAQCQMSSSYIINTLTEHPWLQYSHDAYIDLRKEEIDGILECRADPLPLHKRFGAVAA